MAPNWTAPTSARRRAGAKPIRMGRKKGANTAREIASLRTATDVGSSPASPLLRPNENAQMNETTRRRIIGGLAEGGRGSDPEDRAQALAQQKADAADHRPQENHRPDPERARKELAVAEELEELEDRLGYREIDLLLREDDRVAHLEHRERECEQGSRHEVGRDKGQRDLDHRPEGGASEVLRGLLERHARLLEAGGRGAHDVGEPADRVGDDEQHGRVAHGVYEGEEAALLGHREVAESEHDPGYRERQHREEIEDLPARDPGAHDDVGDRDAEEHVDHGGDARKLQAVRDRRDGELASERRAKIVERETPRQQARVPVLGERDQNDAPGRDDGDKRDAAEDRRAEPPLRRRKPARAAGGSRLGHHRVARLPEYPLSHGVDEDGACEHHGDKRVGERVAPDVPQAVEDLDARYPRIVEDKRRPELREHPDEHDRAAREETGLDER